MPINMQMAKSLCDGVKTSSVNVNLLKASIQIYSDVTLNIFRTKIFLCFVITFNFMPFQLIDLHAFSINGRQMK